MRESEILVGVISDTHGLPRSEAIGVLRGADVIIHAGDVGHSELIEELRRVVPTCGAGQENILRRSAV